MATIKYESFCVLCGQAVEIDAFILKSSQGELKFCCAGCQSIYLLLNNNETTSSRYYPSPMKKETKK